MITQTGPDVRRLLDEYKERADGVLAYHQRLECDALWTWLINGKMGDDASPEEAQVFYAMMVRIRANELENATEENRVSAAIALGRAVGLMDAQWNAVDLKKDLDRFNAGVRKSAAKKWRKSESNRQQLIQFIVKHGPIPPAVEFGKTNPARTKYFQKFKRETGVDVRQDALNRYEKSITPEEVEAAREAAPFLEEMMALLSVAAAGGGVKVRRKSGRFNAHQRRLQLVKYIEEHGPVPPLGEFGRENPDRTRYYNQFRASVRGTFNLEVFERDVEAISAKQD
jgi:hypothetical protein